MNKFENHRQTHISTPSFIVSENDETIEFFSFFFGPNHWKGTVRASKWQSTCEFDHFRHSGFPGERQWGQFGLEGDAFNLC
jgi:hypothetical protein